MEVFLHLPKAEKGRVELAEDLNRSEKTVKNALNELENAGLLSRVRQSL